MDEVLQAFGEKLITDKTAFDMAQKGNLDPTPKPEDNTYMSPEEHEERKKQGKKNPLWSSWVYTGVSQTPGESSRLMVLSAVKSHSLPFSL